MKGRLGKNIWNEILPQTIYIDQKRKGKNPTPNYTILNGAGKDVNEQGGEQTPK